MKYLAMWEDIEIIEFDSMKSRDEFIHGDDGVAVTNTDGWIKNDYDYRNSLFTGGFVASYRRALS